MLYISIYHEIRIILQKIKYNIVNVKFDLFIFNYRTIKDSAQIKPQQLYTQAIIYHGKVSEHLYP